MSDLTERLVARCRAGDEQAAEQLFHRYASRLIALARSRLPGRLAQRVDPEDVVQSVYRSFFADVRADRFHFERGGELWHLLVTITLHKLHDQIKWHSRGKRAVQRESGPGGAEGQRALEEHLRSHEPSPLEAVALVEQVEQLMHRLRPLSRQILELRLQGWNLEEIAVAVGRSQRSVIRVLNEVKSCLEQWGPERFHS